MEDVVKILSESPFGAYPILKSRNLLQGIVDSTDFLEKHYPSISWSQRFWHIKNNVYHIIVCPNEGCDRPASFNKKSKYSYCCTKCRKKSSVKKYKETSIKKHGVDNPSKLQKFRDKQKQSMIKRYGTLNNYKIPHIAKKMKSTSIRKYGVDHPLKSEIIREKIRNTNIEIFGVPNPFNDKNIRERIKKTNKRKYGNENVAKTKYSKDKFTKIKFSELDKNLGNDYMLKEIGHEYRIFHKACDREFFINKTTYQSRIRYGCEICTKCNPINSKLGKENSLYKYLCNICDNTIRNCKDIISPQEIDIYIPEYNLAIEFNGLYWHSELFKNKNYHKIKSENCYKKNIHLLHIWEDDWLYKQDIVKSIINGYLGKHRKIYGRKCIIQKLSAKLCREFIDNCHIQGFVPATIYYGLFYENELVQVMSFKRIKNDDWEISRLCFKLNTRVIGGVSRLFKHFIKNNKFDSLISYCLRDYFNGNVYETIGMKFIRSTPPNYYYFKPNGSNIRLSRQKFQKHKLVKKMSGNKSEREMMLEMKYLRIYNSGNFLFSL